MMPNLCHNGSTRIDVQATTPSLQYKSVISVIHHLGNGPDILWNASSIIQGFPWLARNIGAHIPRIRSVSKRGRRLHVDEFVPLFSIFLLTVDVFDAHDLHASQQLDNPLALRFDTGRTIAKIAISSLTSPKSA